ncbi:MAG: hypothetical protein FJ387_01070 [Verrucomicrobia bacterium]|nr:hypothetical protein [Verrucomicrobiota bacterium]
MTLGDYLPSRGLSQKVIEELLPHIPEHADDGVFCDMASIMAPDRCFYWPGQTRFVVVGHCPNGDGVALDTQEQPGAVFYVAHELLGGERALEDVVVRVAESPSDFLQKLLEDDDFPYDYCDAKSRNVEPGAAPNGGPATPLGNSRVTEGPPSAS